MNPKIDFKTIQRNARRPIKYSVLSPNCVGKGKEWELIRKNNRILGMFDGYNGDAKTEREIREERERLQKQIERRDRNYAGGMAIFVIEDVLFQNNIIDSYFTEYIDSIRNNAFKITRNGYTNNEILDLHKLLQEFIDKYILFFDNYSKNSLEEARKEAIKILKLEEKHNLLCLIFGHKFGTDKYSVIFDNKKRCIRCNKLEG